MLFLLVRLKETDPFPVLHLPKPPPRGPHQEWLFSPPNRVSLSGLGNEIHVSYASLHVYYVAGPKEQYIDNILC